MTKIEQISSLKQITDTALTAAHSKMVKIQYEEVTLRQQLQDLSAGRQTSLAMESPAHKAGADVRWQRWVDHRREMINLELARVLARKEAAKINVRLAFGKDQAMQKILAKLKAQIDVKVRRS